MKYSKIVLNLLTLALRCVHCALVAGNGLRFCCQRKVGWSIQNHQIPENFLLVKDKNFSLNVEMIDGSIYDNVC